jgi:hypothetical protein
MDRSNTVPPLKKRNSLQSIMYKKKEIPVGLTNSKKEVVMNMDGLVGKVTTANDPYNPQLVLNALKNNDGNLEWVHYVS